MTRRNQRVPEDEELETTKYDELTPSEKLMIQEAYNEALGQDDDYTSD